MIYIQTYKYTYRIHTCTHMTHTRLRRCTHLMKTAWVGAIRMRERADKQYKPAPASRLHQHQLDGCSSGRPEGRVKSNPRTCAYTASLCTRCHPISRAGCCLTDDPDMACHAQPAASNLWRHAQPAASQVPDDITLNLLLESTWWH